MEGCYIPQSPTPAPQPTMVKFNYDLANELGLDAPTLDSALGAAICAGNVIPEGAQPVAQVYAGHQFGNFVPQLGDGRALLLGELCDRHGQRRDLVLKGCGRTPFSRGGDGKAALGPVLREYLIGEAMHALGIPTSRALAVVRTGELVHRETALPGAVLTRVAASHIRVGTFQYFAMRGDYARVQQLADFCITRHVPELHTQPERYLGLLKTVCERQAKLIAQWMGIGFIHGVMNTDNMAVAGETLDYGPCAFMDHYDPATVFSSIDVYGRYAYAQQPLIAQWNLARLAETLIPLLHTDTKHALNLATTVIEEFPQHYQNHWLTLMRRKLGLIDAEPEDLTLAQDFLATLHTHQIDFTLAFRHLSEAATDNTTRLLHLFNDTQAITAWLPRWQARLTRQSVTPATCAQTLLQINPVYIPRNHQVETALAAAIANADLAPFTRLLTLVTNPYVQQADAASYALPTTAEQAAGFRTFCGT